MSIERIGVGPRMSQAVVHGDTVYLAGAGGRQSRRRQRRRADARRSSGSSTACSPRPAPTRQHLLSTTIYLADIKTFAEMNAVWEAWVAPGHTPARATVEAKLAAPQFTVEIACIAAKPAG